MPTINSCIAFSQESLDKIAAIKQDPNYSHTSWSDVFLESVRCEIRDFYRREQRLNCIYCFRPVAVLAAASAPVEHILPKSLYLQFMFEPKNLCVVCADCNEYKRDREVIADTPLTGRAARDYPIDTSRYRLFHPHFDEYQDHIIKVGDLYFEKSRKGGHTIYVCNLNRFVQTFGLSEEFINSIETMIERERFHRS